MENITIQHLEKPDELDIQQIFHVWEKDIKRRKDFLNDNQFKMEQGLVARELRDSHVFAARDGKNGIVGFILTDHKRIIRTDILPKYDKTDLRKKLVNYLLENSEASLVSVDEMDEPTYNFYLNLGFRPVEKSKTNDYGLPVPTIRMKRDNLKEG